ncbi:MAG: hypothetical protein AAFR44_16760, partial [Pseudomonadota bacterium]
ARLRRCGIHRLDFMPRDADLHRFRIANAHAPRDGSGKALTELLIKVAAKVCLLTLNRSWARLAPMRPWRVLRCGRDLCSPGRRHRSLVGMGL